MRGTDAPPLRCRGGVVLDAHGGGPAGVGGETRERRWPRGHHLDLVRNRLDGLTDGPLSVDFVIGCQEFRHRA